jgi:hypothetical protein
MEVGREGVGGWGVAVAGGGKVVLFWERCGIMTNVRFLQSDIYIRLPGLVYGGRPLSTHSMMIGNLQLALLMCTKFVVNSPPEFFYYQPP